MCALVFDRAAMRRIREQRGLSRQQLADKLGRNVSTVSNWQYGLKTPLLATIGEIADVLGVPYTDLITRFDDRDEVAG
ncbi:helix-turn-helix transcriptional regulator [Streptomyces sp. NPDC047117]|uniref:helix-turn-helix domain-containing protein n=1 Tax=Streptomyces sp. NPDC047117 TaxID=3155379 RepID=UPI0033DD4E0D